MKFFQRLLAAAKPHLVEWLALCGTILAIHVMTATSEAPVFIRLFYFIFEVCVTVVFLSESIVIGGFSTVLLMISMVIGGFLLLVALVDHPRRRYIAFGDDAWFACSGVGLISPMVLQSQNCHVVGMEESCLRHCINYDICRLLRNILVPQCCHYYW